MYDKSLTMRKKEKKKITLNLIFKKLKIRTY